MRYSTTGWTLFVVREAAASPACRPRSSILLKYKVPIYPISLLSLKTGIAQAPLLFGVSCRVHLSFSRCALVQGVGKASTSGVVTFECATDVHFGDFLNDNILKSASDARASRNVARRGTGGDQVFSKRWASSLSWRMPTKKISLLCQLFMRISSFCAF